MTDQYGGRTVFDPELLESAQRKLADRPHQAALAAADRVTVAAGAFGLIPGGADAAARLSSWVGQTRTDMGTVDELVADLAARTGQAAQMAREVGEVTAAVALRGMPGSGGGGNGAV